MSKLFDANNKMIDLEKPADVGDGDDTNNLRAMRMMNINNELKKVEKSESEAFFNFIEREKFNLEEDREKIITTDQFHNYYFINNLSTIYIESCEGDLEFSENPEILGIIVIFDKLFHTHKWRIKAITDYFVKRNMDMAGKDEKYGTELIKEFNNFYDKNILKKESNIN